MQELQIFNFEDLPVRTLTVDDEPYFVGKDVAEILGYSKSRNAIAKHVDIEDKKDAPIRGSLGGTQKNDNYQRIRTIQLNLLIKIRISKKI